MLVEKFEARMLHLENRLFQAEETINNQDMRINKQNILIDNQNILIDKQKFSIEQNKFYINKTLFKIQKTEHNANLAQETANNAHNMIAQVQIAIQTAQDGVDYLVKYTKDIDRLAHHTMNSLNNLKNSYSWRSISIFERVLRKIKQKIKRPIVSIPIKEDIIKERPIEESPMEAYINIESPRAKEIYENLNHR